MTVEASPTGIACKPIEKKVGKATIRLQHGDLTALPVDAFVFYAREDLQLGSGYGTAIQGRGGASIQKELDAIGGIRMGEAGVKTLAFPPMGTGFYGVPLDLSADIMLDYVKFFLEGDSSLEEVIICVIDYRDYAPFSKRMESL